MIIGTSLSEVREIRGDCKIVPELEGWTGADLMISPLPIPVTQALLPVHLSKGALFVQVKRGHDLPNSIIDGRLSHSLAQMRAAGARPWQCILLFVGLLTALESGGAMINGSVVNANWPHPYITIKSALSKWMKRGGTVEELSYVNLIPAWAEMQLKLVAEMQAEPEHLVYAEVDNKLGDDSLDPLQTVIYVNDWRKTLLSLPGLGPVRAKSLLDHLQGKVTGELTLTTCLHWLTNEKLIKGVPGIGKGTVANIRAWFGLNDGMTLSTEPEEL